jgi:hypothetical protein
MWEGRSDYFPAEGRQPGSGSKKPGAGSATRARPIPRPPGATRAAPGSGEPPLGGSYGADGGGSAGSLHRRPASFAERFAREREAASGGAGAGASLLGTSPSASAPLGASLGAGSAGRGVELSAGSGSRPSRASDTFERILPERCAPRFAGPERLLSCQPGSVCGPRATQHLPVLPCLQGGGAEACGGGGGGREALSGGAALVGGTAGGHGCGALAAGGGCPRPAPRRCGRHGCGRGRLAAGGGGRRGGGWPAAGHAARRASGRGVRCRLGSQPSAQPQPRARLAGAAGLRSGRRRPRLRRRAVAAAHL